MKVMKVRHQPRSHFPGVVSKDKLGSCLANYLPFKEDGTSFLQIYLFIPLCSLPEKIVSCDSVSLQLSRVPPSTSLGVISPLHGGASLGGLCRAALHYRL